MVIIQFSTTCRSRHLPQSRNDLNTNCQASHYLKYQGLFISPHSIRTAKIIRFSNSTFEPQRSRQISEVQIIVLQIPDTPLASIDDTIISTSPDFPTLLCSRFMFWLKLNSAATLQILAHSFRGLFHRMPRHLFSHDFDRLAKPTIPQYTFIQKLINLRYLTPNFEIDPPKCVQICITTMIEDYTHRIFCHVFEIDEVWGSVQGLVSSFVLSKYALYFMRLEVKWHMTPRKSQ